MKFEIEYTPDWSNKPVWKTELEAEDRADVRYEFKKFYPRATIKSIKLVEKS